jgi:ABC-type molybdate transport system permease subunit
LSSLLFAVSFGTPIAYLLARRRFRGAVLLDTLIDLPMVLPPTVAGVALLMAFGRRGILSSWLDVVGIQIGFTTLAVVLVIARQSPLPILKDISWSVLPLVAGLFVVVAGLNRTGALSALAGNLHDAAATSPQASAWNHERAKVIRLARDA